MEYMKVLHLTLFVSQLDLFNLYHRGVLYFVITSRSPSAVEVQSLLLGILLYPFPQNLFSCFFPFDVCLKASTYIKHATKKVLKVY